MIISQRIALDLYLSYESVREYCLEQADVPSRSEFERLFIRPRTNRFLQRLVCRYLDGPGQPIWQVLMAKYCKSTIPLIRKQNDAIYWTPKSGLLRRSRIRSHLNDEISHYS